MLCIESLEDLDFLAVRLFSPARGLVGRLPPRRSPLGGFGNELMLTVLRIVLGPKAPEPTAGLFGVGVFGAVSTGLLAFGRAGLLICGKAGLFGCGRADVGAGDGGARPNEGDLREVWGKFGADLDEVMVGMLPVLFLVFVIGKAGNAMFGGPFDGREGRGKVGIVDSAMLSLFLVTESTPNAAS